MKIITRLNAVSGLQLFQVIRFSGILLTSILLAKCSINISIIGNYEKLLLIAGVFSFFWVQGILNSLLSSYNSHAFKRVYLFNSFILISLISAIVFGLMQLFSGSIQLLFFNGFQPGYRYLCLYIFFNSPCFLIESIYLLRQKTKSLIAYGIISACLSMAAVIIPLIQGYTVETALSFLVLWSVLRFFWLIRLLIRNATPDFRLSILKEHFFLAWPLIISYLIGGSADYIDGLMATHYFGAEAFAVFRYGAREFPLSLILGNALSMAMIPFLRQTVNGELNLRDLKKHTSRLMDLVFPLSILLLFVSKSLYPIIFDQRFTESANIFNIYLLLAASRMVFPQSIVLALNKNKAILVISSIEIFINIAFSYLFMLKFGIIGIAWGTVIAYCAEKFMLCAYLQMNFKISVKDYVPFTKWLVYIALLSIGFMIVS